MAEITLEVCPASNFAGILRIAKTCDIYWKSAQALTTYVDVMRFEGKLETITIAESR